jgi:glutathione synthase/RimK-type ligase-like ATP-grasp enzyme
MTKNRVAIVTFERLPNLSPDDQLLLRELARLGLAVEAVIWSDGSVDWSKFSSIVIRSCWDYHHRHEAFLEWLTKIEALGLSIWNRPNLIRWNIDKIYLRALQEKGVRIPATVWVDQGNSVDVREVLRSQGWQRAVVKPRVSASGHRTLLVGEELGRQKQIDQVFHVSGGLIQEFLDMVETEGEWSFLFFNKKYSHAVLKRPKSGEFRTQIEHGGSFDLAIPPRDYVEVAQIVINSIGGPLLFARVDGVPVAGKFTLMELELIEPYLFLSLAESAVSDLVKAFFDIARPCDVL